MTGEATPRAVVADDSSFMQAVITDILEEDGVDVVSQVPNGEDALEAVVEHDPDVVTMDVEMPVMGGLEAVEAIMDRQPTPILMLSAHTDEDADVTFEALQRGAVDFFAKPGGEVSVKMSRFKEQLARKVRSVASSDVRTHRSATGTPEGSVETADKSFLSNATVIIGASTGGPRVVENVLAALPIAADLRIVVVQHMPPEFTPRYATRLDRASEYHIREATDGMRIRGGEGVVAPGDHHLEVTAYRDGRFDVALTDDPPVHGVRPAIDVTMESAAEIVTGPLVGVILTGMGEDGAAGVTRLSAEGGTVITQDEPTSAVFGMPKRAIEAGCVEAVLPASAIANGITDAVTAPAQTPGDSHV